MYADYANNLKTHRFWSKNRCYREHKKRNSIMTNEKKFRKKGDQNISLLCIEKYAKKNDAYT